MININAARPRATEFAPLGLVPAPARAEAFREPARDVYVGTIGAAQPSPKMDTIRSFFQASAGTYTGRGTVTTPRGANTYTTELHVRADGRNGISLVTAAFVGGRRINGPLQSFFIANGVLYHRGDQGAGDLGRVEIKTAAKDGFAYTIHYSSGASVQGEMKVRQDGGLISTDSVLRDGKIVRAYRMNMTRVGE